MRCLWISSLKFRSHPRPVLLRTSAGSCGDAKGDSAASFLCNRSWATAQPAFPHAARAAFCRQQQTELYTESKRWSVQSDSEQLQSQRYRGLRDIVRHPCRCANDQPEISSPQKPTALEHESMSLFGAFRFPQGSALHASSHREGQTHAAPCISSTSYGAGSPHGL